MNGIIKLMLLIIVITIFYILYETMTLWASKKKHNVYYSIFQMPSTGTLIGQSDERNYIHGNPVYDFNGDVTSTLKEDSETVTAEKQSFISQNNVKGERILVLTSIWNRIGNDMFQLASLYGIAKINGYKLVIAENFMLSQYFDLNITKMPVNWSGFKNATQSGYITADVYQGKPTFDKKLLNVSQYIEKDIITIHGYLQSWRYFHRVKDEVRQLFRFKDSIQTAAKEFIDGIRSKMKNTTIIGIHVRLGDVTTEKNYRAGYRIPPIQYFKKAIYFYQKTVPNNPVFVICSNNITWVKSVFLTHIIQPNLVLCPEGNRGAQDLAILSQCEHIIMSVGTFGWWAGFLAGGYVTYYGNHPAYGSPLARHITPTNFYPRDWVNITVV